MNLHPKVYLELQQCKSFNSLLLNRIINWSAMLLRTLSTAKKKQLKSKPVPAEIQDDVLEASVCKALSR